MSQVLSGWSSSDIPASFLKQKWNKGNLPKLAAILGVSILDFFRDPADLPFLAEGEAAQALFSLARDERLTDEEKRAMDREIADFIVYLRERRTGGHGGGHP